MKWAPKFTLKATFQGDTVAFDGDSHRVQLRIDPTKDPKWIDFFNELLGDYDMPGIYTLDGDRLTLHYAVPHAEQPAERPERFGVARPGQIILHYERARKAH